MNINYPKFHRVVAFSEMAKSLFCITLLGLLAMSMAQAPQCGQSPLMRANREPDSDGRIVGGVEPRPFSHPWIISLHQGSTHYCGATLLNVGHPSMTDVIVTAAHCVVDGIADVTANAGAHDLDRPTSNQQTVPAAAAVAHEQYNPTTTLHDIALIKLARPIKFTAAAQPICLPAPGEKVPDNTQGTVAGWGFTGEGVYDYQTILLQVGVPTINSTVCRNVYAAQAVQIDETAMLCAGYAQGGKDSCQGDSGGPFVFKKGNNYVLQGVVSFGVGCARRNSPGVYARVSNYIGWINGKVAKLTALKPQG